MKQGRASYDRMTGTKVEPISHAVSETAVAQLGIMQGNHAGDAETQNLPYQSRPLYEGRGLKAPMVGTTQHHCGSQGKY